MSSKPVRQLTHPSLFVQLVAVGVTLYVLFQARQVLMIVLLAFVTMMALHPAVSKLTKRRMPRSVAIALVLILISSLLVGLGAIILPPLVLQLIALVETLQNAPWVKQQLGTIIDELKYWQISLSSAQLSLASLSQFAGAVSLPANLILSAITTILSNIFTVISFFVFTGFLLWERPVLFHKARWFTASARTIVQIETYLNTLERQLGGWFRAEIILMLVIGTLSYVVFSVMGLPYALPLAVLAGLLELVPNVGPSLAAVPAAIIGFATFGWVGGLITVVVAIAIQQFENNVLVPRVMKTSAQVNPLLVLLLIMLGTAVAGVLGAILAVPSYIIIRSGYFHFFYPQSIGEKSVD